MGKAEEYGDQRIMIFLKRFKSLGDNRIRNRVGPRIWIIIREIEMGHSASVIDISIPKLR